MRRKNCFKCHRELPIGDFYKHPQMADGHLNKCKECAKADTRKNYDTEKQYAYDLIRRERPERKAAAARYKKKARAADPERFREYHRQSRARHPEKQKPRWTLSNALRDGRIKRQPCEKCGVSGKKNGRSIVHAHHEDYSKPLEVRWLCSKCHGREHRRRPLG
jgi:hypothetical protein